MACRDQVTVAAGIEVDMRRARGQSRWDTVAASKSGSRTMAVSTAIFRLLRAAIRRALMPSDAVERSENVSGNAPTMSVRLGGVQAPLVRPGLACVRDTPGPGRSWSNNRSGAGRWLPRGPDDRTPGIPGLVPRQPLPSLCISRGIVRGARRGWRACPCPRCGGRGRWPGSCR